MKINKPYEAPNRRGSAYSGPGRGSSAGRGSSVGSGSASGRGSSAGSGSASGSAHHTTGNNGSAGSSPYHTASSGSKYSHSSVPVRGPKKFDVKLLIASIAAGIAGGIVGIMLYNALKGEWYTPLVIAVACGAFFAVYGLIMILYASIRGMYTAKHNMGAGTLVPYVLCIIGIFAAALLFEYIYELGGAAAAQEPSSYIFLIDNSGSMAQSDPEKIRYDAIDQILEGKEETFPYAVYTFDDHLVSRRAMAAQNAGEYMDGKEIDLGGGTAIKGALVELEKEFTSGNLTEAGDAPKVLLLSDGYATDLGFFSSPKSILKKLARKGIMISTVGLGTPDENLMKQIADMTGGVYVSVTDVRNLTSSMEKAIASIAERDLLSVRHVTKMNWLYFLERTLFMGIIGIAVGLVMVAALQLDKSELAVYSALLKGGISGLILELLLNLIYVPERAADLCYFVLIAVLLATYYEQIKQTNTDTSAFNKGHGKPEPAAEDPTDNFRTGKRAGSAGEAKGFDQQARGSRR